MNAADGSSQPRACARSECGRPVDSVLSTAALLPARRWHRRCIGVYYEASWERDAIVAAVEQERAEQPRTLTRNE